jgi:hypothetical protein
MITTMAIGANTIFSSTNDKGIPVLMQKEHDCYKDFQIYLVLFGGGMPPMVER